MLCSLPDLLQRTLCARKLLEDALCQASFAVIMAVLSQAMLVQITLEADTWSDSDAVVLRFCRTQLANLIRDTGTGAALHVVPSPLPSPILVESARVAGEHFCHIMPEGGS